MCCCDAVFTCVGALAILDRLDVLDGDTLGWWLAERQLPNGGLNGRPEKLEDVSASIASQRTWSMWQLAGLLRPVYGPELSLLTS